MRMTIPDSTSRNESDSVDRERAGDRARQFFDSLWNQGDYWKLETCAFEQARYARLMEFLRDRRYSRTLEIGCGAGAFTRLLAGVSERVVALDVSPAAIERAQRADGTGGSVEFRVANVMEIALEEESPWDLIVMNETVYYLGWLYPSSTSHGWRIDCSRSRPTAAASSWRIPSATLPGISCSPR